MDYLSLFEMLWFAMFIFWILLLCNVNFFFLNFECSPVNVAFEFSFYNCKEDVSVIFFHLCFSTPQDEGLRLRKVAHSDKSGSPTALALRDNGSNSLPSLLVVIAAIFIGFFLGKFIL